MPAEALAGVAPTVGVPKPDAIVSVTPLPHW